MFVVEHQRRLLSPSPSRVIYMKKNESIIFFLLLLVFLAPFSFIFIHLMSLKTPILIAFTHVWMRSDRTASWPFDLLLDYHIDLWRSFDLPYTLSNWEFGMKSKAFGPIDARAHLKGGKICPAAKRCSSEDLRELRWTSFLSPSFPTVCLRFSFLNSVIIRTLYYDSWLMEAKKTFSPRLSRNFSSKLCDR